MAKRKNRTILDMAQSMLKSKKLPKKFWVEVVACTVYLSNRSPTRSVWGKTPQEAWSGRRPDVSHLRVFESVAHVHIPYEKKAKLGDKSGKFIFVGYDQSSKGYKLYNPDNNKIVISRDVIFNEEREWDFGVCKKEYNFFPEFEEETSIEFQLVPCSLTSPTSEDTSSERITTRTQSPQDLYDNIEPLSQRSLKDIYEETRETNNITLFCLFADC